MDFLSTLGSHLMADQATQSIILGFVVNLLTNQWKKVSVKVDEDGNKKYKVPVQLMVIVLSGLASLGDMYVNSKLGTYDPQTLVNFLTVILPTYLSAMGIHLLKTDIKKAKEEPKTETK